MKLEFVLNGRPVSVEVPGAMRLLDLLREVTRVTGTKEGCGEGECGACTVLLDGRPIMSCLTPAAQVAGHSIVTVEGLGHSPTGAALQTAFADHGGSQCGICTPGMVLAAAAYLADAASADSVGEALAGNLCRCTGYTKIFAAVEAARARGHS